MYVCEYNTTYMVARICWANGSADLYPIFSYTWLRTWKRLGTFRFEYCFSGFSFSTDIVFVLKKWKKSNCTSIITIEYARQSDCASFLFHKYKQTESHSLV